MLVEILETEPSFGLTAGEIYQAERYWLDPHEKFTLLGRVPDGYDPSCNVYRHQVRVLARAATPEGHTNG